MKLPSGQALGLRLIIGAILPTANLLPLGQEPITIHEDAPVRQAPTREFPQRPPGALPHP